MRALDLIPPEVTARRETGGRIRAWARRLILTAVAGAVLFAGLYRLEEGRNSELARLMEQYGSLERRLERAADLVEEHKHLAGSREAIGLLRDERTAGSLLQVLDETLTPESYLTSLNIERCPLTDPEEVPAGEQETCFATMRVRGLATGHKDVGHVIRNMITSGAFSDVALVSSRYIEDSTGPRSVEFEILCVLAGEGSTPEGRRYGALEAERPYD